jgi:hypothetical protein
VYKRWIALTVLFLATTTKTHATDLEQVLPVAFTPDKLMAAVEEIRLDETEQVTIVPDESPDYDANTADESSLVPHIPEPMIFDLVRPLGAHKGEFEINTLGVLPLTSEKMMLEWAPEIEYAFRDGHAVELELPFENKTLDTLKLAYQATLPSPKPSHMAHGIQTIGRYAFSPRAVSLEATYLLGYALNHKFSVMTITGGRAKVNQESLRWNWLVNPTLFYHVNNRVTVGIENNLRLRNTRDFDMNIVPQVFIEFGRYSSLQVGAGVTRQRSGVFKPLLAMRFIVAIH